MIELFPRSAIDNYNFGWKLNIAFLRKVQKEERATGRKHNLHTKYIPISDIESILLAGERIMGEKLNGKE